MNEYYFYIFNPFLQGASFLISTILLLVIFRPSSMDGAWTWAGVLFLLFMGSNSLLLIFQESTWSYAGWSLLSSAAYLLLISYVVEAYGGIFNSHGSGESSMIFLAIIYHPALLAAGMFIKWLL